MTDATRRAIRTFLQGFVGVLAATGIPMMQDLIRAASSGEPYEFNYDLWQSLIVSAITGGIIALISWSQNALEDNTGMKAILKAPASSGVNPVPHDGGPVA